MPPVAANTKGEKHALSTSRVDCSLDRLYGCGIHTGDVARNQVKF